MKRKELYDIEKRLQSVRQPGKTMTLVMADNKKKIVDLITEMEKTKEPSDAYKQHVKDVEQLKRAYAKKDHIGRPEMKPGKFPDGTNGMFYTIEGSENPDSEYRKALRDLEIKNKDIILEQEKKEIDFWEVYLEEKIEPISYRKIKYSEIPKDISQDEMDVLIYFNIVCNIPDTI